MKTMTAEEVTEAVEQIRSNMEIAFDHVGKDEVALAWLSRLAAQAARVPGLAETLEELAHLMECEATGPALLVRMRAEKQACSDFETQMLNAESERDAAQRDLVGVVNERDSLRERVDTLEAEVDSLKTAVTGADRLWEQQQTRADTAEARVREMEGQMRAKAAALRLAKASERWDVVTQVADALSSLASQPPPAPAQEPSGMVDVTHLPDEDIPHVESCLPTVCKFGLGGECPVRPSPSPTSPPGLREAVEPVLRHLEGLTLTNGALVSNIERLRAAYDATGGAETLDKARVVEVLRNIATARDMLEALHENAERLGLTLDTPPSVVPQKPERPPYRGCHADRDGDCSWAECPQRTNPAHHCPLDTGEDDDAPPSGPGGGEEVIPMGPFGVMAAKDAPTFARIAPTPTPDDGPPMSADDLALIDGAWQRHAAVKPTPTPSSRDMAMRKLLGAVGKLVSVYSEISGETPAETAASFEPSLSPAPESAPDSNSPQTPDVVWEWPHLGHWRVTADGALWTKSWSPQGWVWVVSPAETEEADVASALARALAEAKREVATLKAAADGDLKATDADRGNASLAWGCAGSIQTALRRERANRVEFARKAAESMRERAAETADGGPLRVRGVLMTPSERIRALPLEAP